MKLAWPQGCCLSSLWALSIVVVWGEKHPQDCSMQASLSITKSWSLLKLMYIESVMPSNHLILCHRLLLLPSIVLIKIGRAHV